MGRQSIPGSMIRISGHIFRSPSQRGRFYSLQAKDEEDSRSTHSIYMDPADLQRGGEGIVIITSATAECAQLWFAVRGRSLIRWLRPRPATLDFISAAKAQNVLLPTRLEYEEECARSNSPIQSPFSQLLTSIKIYYFHSKRYERVIGCGGGAQKRKRPQTRAETVVVQNVLVSWSNGNKEISLLNVLTAKDVECFEQEATASFTYSATSHLRCQESARECQERSSLIRLLINRTEGKAHARFKIDLRPSLKGVLLQLQELTKRSAGSRHDYIVSAGEDEV